MFSLAQYTHTLSLSISFSRSPSLRLLLSLSFSHPHVLLKTGAVCQAVLARDALNRVIGAATVLAVDRFDRRLHL